MDTNRKNLQHYINTNKCVSLPLKDECYYLRIDNYLSEYLTEQEKLLVLDNLGITSRINDLSKTLTDKFNLYATLKYLDEYYVKKIDLYYPEDEDDDDGFDTIKAPGEIGDFGYGHVDDFLSLTSLNPVLNRIITAALNEKADISTLLGYVSIENLANYLVNYLKILQAGTGIKIQGNVISSTLDLNPFVIVQRLPETGNPNKIYLTPAPTQLIGSNGNTSSGNYILYIYDPDLKEWIEIGRISLDVLIPDFSNYITLSQADERYIRRGESVGVSLNTIKELLKNYVKKSEVYTPDQYGTEEYSGNILDSDPTIDWNQSSSSGGGTNTITGIIDAFLDSTSPRAVANKAIVAALKLKLDTLTAGEGITILNGVISSTFDTNLYEFVDNLPIGGGSTSKIYLVELPDGVSYKQYVWRQVAGEWKWQYKGIKDLGADLSLYLTKSSASETYMSKTELEATYATKTQLNELISAGLGGGTSGTIYATKDYVDGLYATIDLNTLSLLALLKEALDGEGGFALIVIALSSKVDINDVYTKDLADERFLRSGSYLTTDNFNNYYNQILNKFESFIIDLNISAISSNAVANKTIYNALLKKINSDVVEELYVKKDELQSLVEFPTFKTINGLSITGTGDITINVNIPIDSTVTRNSANPVSSAGLYEYLTDELFYKLDKLVAGSGIAIRNSVISVTLDSVNPFIIADSRPNVADAVENKLYLIKEGLVYKQYQLVNGQWEDKGSLDFSVDLSAYLKIADANFTTPNDITQLRTWINNTFVKKADVYTPTQDDSTSQGVTDTTGTSSGSGNGGSSILPGEGAITISTYYNSNISDGVTTNIPVGNIPMGTDIATLKGRSFSDLFDRILFKETWPNPNYKHTISMTVSNNIVKVGSVIALPTITTNWNSNILPQSSITASLKIRVPGSQTNQDFVAGSTYDTAGTYVFTLNYSYPSGSYLVTSNYGNPKTINVNGSTGTKVESVQATYPWYINNEEQSTLVPINGNHTEEIFLTGSPVIEIPGANSICNILADLGLGYMDVSWTKSSTVRDGVVYSTWTKQDAYLQDVKHKITFTIYNT